MRSRRYRLIYCGAAVICLAPARTRCTALPSAWVARDCTGIERCMKRGAAGAPRGMARKTARNAIGTFDSRTIESIEPIRKSVTTVKCPTVLCTCRRAAAASDLETSHITGSNLPSDPSYLRRQHPFDWHAVGSSRLGHGAFRCHLGDERCHLRARLHLIDHPASLSSSSKDALRVERRRIGR